MGNKKTYQALKNLYRLKTKITIHLLFMGVIKSLAAWTRIFVHLRINLLDTEIRDEHAAPKGLVC